MSEVTKQCKYCQTEFRPYSEKHKFCSAECSTECNYRLSISRQWATKFKILERDGFRCFYCGEGVLECKQAFEIDHVIPRSANGEDTIYNKVICCKKCNRAKGDTIFEEDILKAMLKEVNDRTENFISIKKDLSSLMMEDYIEKRRKHLKFHYVMTWQDKQFHERSGMPYQNPYEVVDGDLVRVHQTEAEKSIVNQKEVKLHPWKYKRDA